MQAAQSTFISSTNWTDRVGPVAALATIKKYCENNVDKHLIEIGNGVKKIWEEEAITSGLKVSTSGLATLASFSFDSSFNMEMSTRFVIEMLNHNILGFRQFKPSFAHSQGDLDQYRRAVSKIFSLLSELPQDNLLDTPVAHNGLFRLTKE